MEGVDELALCLWRKMSVRATRWSARARSSSSSRFMETPYAKTTTADVGCWRVFHPRPVQPSLAEVVQRGGSNRSGLDRRDRAARRLFASAKWESPSRDFFQFV